MLHNSRALARIAFVAAAFKWAAFRFPGSQLYDEETSPNTGVSRIRLRTMRGIPSYSTVRRVA